MFTVEEHWRYFAEFAKFEQASGGPDPQLRMVAGMSEDISPEELVWRAGCYIAVYNVPFAEAIWREWPWERISQNPDGLGRWLAAEFPRIVTRLERRTVRRPDWMKEYLLGYAEWAKNYPELKAKCAEEGWPKAYDIAWESALTVPRLGRYVALKLLEFLRRYDGLEANPTDIRPEGGWSPRETLATLWDDPDCAERSDRPEVLDRIRDLCEATVSRLADEYEVEVDLFELQVLLCEYRESWESKRQYPGRSLDSELKYALQAEKLWERPSTIWEARKRVFPHEHLGEINGWEAPRELCAQSLALYGTTWTDLRFDYHKSKPGFYTRRDGRLQVKELLAPSKHIAVSKPPKIYTVIEGKVYQSARWNLMTVEYGKQLAAKHGITMIVNLWKHHPEIAEMVDKYLWIPLADGRVVDRSALLQACDAAERHIAEGGKVLTMCWGGRNRSGLLSALLVHRLNNCSGGEAISVVKKARRGALVNAHFTKFLETIESKSDLRRGLLF